jgi:glycosyltransferase involved in cell wall biosynthesis
VIRLAYFSPLPPARSGIADYSQTLLPHLAKAAELTLFVENREHAPGDLQSQFPIQSLSSYPKTRRLFDLALYQMGNSTHHDALYPLALRYPGLVVLHDYGLHHFIAHRTAGQNNYSAYVREMGYTLGPEGVALARAIRDGRAEHPLFDVPLSSRLIDHSLGLIVHSHSVASLIKEQRPDRPVRVIPALMEKAGGRLSREALGLAPETFVLASTGLVTAAKQLDLALQAFARLRKELADSHYLIIGAVHPEVDLGGIIAKLELETAVTHLGFIEDLQTFIDWTAAADVVINLRYPTAGETSATALRALAAGVPVIVNDVGWYSELPGTVASKVQPSDLEGLLAAMQQLARQPALRRKMGQAAVAYIEQHHDPGLAARQYLDFAAELLARVSQKYGGRRD